ncbi:MAG: S-layer homology domain-containing protein [Candidatus Sericytochromatia bacterium]|nr:S-layer homology domain-containing protein [Candidatus Sericytochromatia bacterium]
MLSRCLPAALIFSLLASGAAQAAVEFRDIPPGHWARVPASVLADHRLMGGRTPVDFAGEVPLTRYELAQTISALYREGGPPATFVVLNDMPPGHEATRDVQRVLGFELMKGPKPGLFRGDAGVSREELVEAFDTLLEKNGVSPPARRRQAVFFADVPAGSPLFGTLDRIVNRYALLDSRPGSRFFPQNTVTRFQLLGMLIKALPYLNPAVERELQEASQPTPAPLASRPPDGGPAGLPTPTPAATLPAQTASALPTTQPRSGMQRPLWQTRGQLNGSLILLYNEDLPRQTGAVTTGEPPQFSGSMLGGGGASGEYWQGPWGGSAQLRTAYLGFDIPHQGRATPVDMLDTTLSGAAWYRLNQEADWELAVGGGALWRSQFNLTGQLVSQYYLSADKTYMGLGPGAAFAYRASADLDVFGRALLLPLFQSYNLPRGPQSLTRLGLDLDGRARYRLVDQWALEGGLGMWLSPALSGGSQTMLGATLGISKDF